MTFTCGASCLMIVGRVLCCASCLGASCLWGEMSVIHMSDLEEKIRG